MTPQVEIAEPRTQNGTFEAEPFLATLDPERCAPGSEELRQLEALVKRVTISGRLHAFYTPDILRPAGDEAAGQGYAELYIGALVRAAAAHGDWKLLNAAFTALDAGLAGDGELAEQAETALVALGGHGP